jgi:hypothetical protein
MKMLCSALPENSMSVHLPRNKLRNVCILRITRTSNCSASALTLISRWATLSAIASAFLVSLMWRNNVLRCGHCYHTARQNHVARAFRRAKSTTSLPIGNDEFMSAMRNGVFVKEPGDDVGKNCLGKCYVYFVAGMN